MLNGRAHATVAHAARYNASASMVPRRARRSHCAGALPNLTHAANTLLIKQFIKLQHLTAGQINGSLIDSIFFPNVIDRQIRFARGG